MGSDTARIFDAMARSYGELEPWYEHLYAILHDILRTALAAHVPGPGQRALDAGCGTGFQTALLAELGWEAHGLDLSPGLLAVAGRTLGGARLVRGDIEALPYPSSAFDVVACCGSTLSFTREPEQAVRELGRVLRPGGRLLLECEHKWSLDLGWALLSSLTGDPLGYGLSAREAGRPLTVPPRAGFITEYPCRTDDGTPARWRLRLFTRSELATMLRAAGLSVERWWGLHALTNVIPSTLLHRDCLPRPLSWLYLALRAMDRRLSDTRAGPWLANSLVLLARKSGG